MMNTMFDDKRHQRDSNPVRAQLQEIERRQVVGVERMGMINVSIQMDVTGIFYSQVKASSFIQGGL
jgi:hypothetical protein